MVPSTDLFELIKALSGSEKRYLKLYAASIGGKKDSAYLRLFDAINRMTEYDEHLLKQQLKNEAFVKQLSVAKNYLYGIILKCLVQFYERSAGSSANSAGLNSIEILYEKGLFKQCHRQIKRAKQQALAQERFYLYDQLLEWEARVFTKSADYNMVAALTAGQLQVLKRREADLQCKKLAYEIYSSTIGKHKSGGGPGKATNQKLMQTLKQMPLPADAGTLGRYYYYSAYTLYYGYAGDVQQRVKHAQKVVEELELHPDFVEVNPGFYTYAANNMCNALLAAGDHAGAKRLLQKIRLFLRKPGSPLKAEMAASTMLLTYHIELLLFINTGQITAAVTLEKHVQQELERYKNYVSRDTEWDMFFSMAHALFLAGDFGKASAWLQKLLNTGKFSARYDLYVVSKLFYLLILVEQEDWKLLQNLCNTIAQYLRRKNLDSGVELELIRLLKAYRNLADTERREGLQKLYQQIELMKQQKKPSLLVELLDVESWLLSKIKNRPIIEMASNRTVQ